MSTELLRFQSFVSVLDPSFWGRFANDKLITYRLDDTALPLTLSYSNALHQSIPPRLCGYAEYSFKLTNNLGPLSVATPSSLLNYNTLDELKAANKAALLNKEATHIWEDMLTLKALKDPALLCRSFFISFADLKRWSFTSWMAVPALTPEGACINAQPLRPLPHAHTHAHGHGHNSAHAHAHAHASTAASASPLPAPSALPGLLSSFLAAREQALPPCMLYDSVEGVLLPYSALPRLMARHDTQHAATQRADMADSAAGAANTAAAAVRAAPSFSLVIVDPSAGTAPGWPARNILLYTGLLMLALQKNENPEEKLENPEICDNPERCEKSLLSVDIPVVFLRDVQKLLGQVSASATAGATNKMSPLENKDLGKSVADVTNVVNPTNGDIDIENTENDSTESVADVTIAGGEPPNQKKVHVIHSTTSSLATVATIAFPRAETKPALTYLNYALAHMPVSSTSSSTTSTSSTSSSTAAFAHLDAHLDADADTVAAAQPLGGAHAPAPVSWEREEDKLHPKPFARPLHAASAPTAAHAHATAGAAHAPGHQHTNTATNTAAPPMPPAPAAVGWERVDGKLRPRVASLESVLDAKEVAKRGVMLNLQLMKWRMLPALDLDKIAQTRCLLLGAGTLGCNVARLLLAWGHTQLTILDSGRVAPSNPIRQNLYSTADVGQYKAEAACEALRRIHPSVHASSAVMTIPMPGHHASVLLPANAAQRQDLLHNVRKLAELISQHDMIFLLTDSRESRWLPAMLAAAYGIPCVNAALGFDSYVVMRHGHRGTGNGHTCPRKNINSENRSADFGKSENSGKSMDTPDVLSQEVMYTPAAHLSHVLPPIPALPLPPTLSCYFCIDITAPGNSFKQRTLDQQCTVTRPGLAYVSAGLAVEMAVALRHAKMGARAPAVLDRTERARLVERARAGEPHAARNGEAGAAGAVAGASMSAMSALATATAAVAEGADDDNDDNTDLTVDVVSRRASSERRTRGSAVGNAHGSGDGVGVVGGASSRATCLHCGEACGGQCEDDCGGLGAMPHQIRGSFSASEQVLMRGTPQPFCCCCGGPVQRLFREQGMQFLENALCVDGYLEEVSGLAAMVRGAEDEEWDNDEFDAAEDL